MYGIRKLGKPEVKENANGFIQMTLDYQPFQKETICNINLQLSLYKCIFNVTYMPQ